MTNDPQLYIVPTPIGNMEDITLRAIETLKKSDIILAEDTRHAKKLLKHYNILTKVNSYHLNNEHKRVDEYVQMIINGNKVSLITSAGTKAVGPGKQVINILFLIASRISKNPGSDIQGVPASVIRETLFPLIII